MWKKMKVFKSGIAQFFPKKKTNFFPKRLIFPCFFLAKNSSSENSLFPRFLTRIPVLNNASSTPVFLQTYFLNAPRISCPASFCQSNDFPDISLFTRLCGNISDIDDIWTLYMYQNRNGFNDCQWFCSTVNHY